MDDSVPMLRMYSRWMGETLRSVARDRSRLRGFMSAGPARTEGV